MKAVKVKWVDSYESQGWQLMENFPATCKKQEITTLGWQVRKDKHGIAVAASYGPDPEQVCGTMFIPAEAIKSVEAIAMPG